MHGLPWRLLRWTCCAATIEVCPFFVCCPCTFGCQTLPPSLILRNVTFSYGERVILRDVSLQVPRSKVTALMGASGEGKTTVLRLIGGQQRPAETRSF